MLGCLHGFMLVGLRAENNNLGYKVSRLEVPRSWTLEHHYLHHDQPWAAVLSGSQNIGQKSEPQELEIDDAPQTGLGQIWRNS